MSRNTAQKCSLQSEAELPEVLVKNHRRVWRLLPAPWWGPGNLLVTMSCVCLRGAQQLKNGWSMWTVS